jgi:concentrative nucleoside transporter, CNT family
MERLSALIGFVVILGIAFAISTNRRAVQGRIVFWGLLLQIIIAVAVLKGALIQQNVMFLGPDIPQAGALLFFIAILTILVFVTKRIADPRARRYTWMAFGIFAALLFLRYNLLAFGFERMKDVVNKLIAFTAQGAKFVFGTLGDGSSSIGFIFATQVLPTIIFIASVFAILYYIGVMPIVVRYFAKVMTRFMGVSGAEATSVAASIFMGQTEAPLTIRPFIPEMTMSELMTVMTAGMAHVSGGIMAAYVLVAKVDVIHLLTAVIMTAPGAIMMAKIIVPETEEPKTGKDVNVVVPKQDVNVIDAAGRGAIEGLHLSLNVLGMLIAFIALVALVNGVFGWGHDLVASWIGADKAWWFPASMDMLLGWIFRPIAWSMGVTWKDSLTVGNLLGTRMVLNEFVAFARLGPLAPTISHRSFIITTYALCGFANFSSIAIQIGGIGSLAPSRRGDLARLGLRAMIAGTLANFLTATIAGMLL